MTDGRDSGSFDREPVRLGERITADAPSRWLAEAGRYRLVVVRACAHAISAPLAAVTSSAP
jgi:putative glutathione S-transferase